MTAFGRRIDDGGLRDEATAQAFRRRVGIVFQSADAQLFSPSVRDEVAFGPLHLDLPREEILARVDDTLALLGLGALAERAPYNLSGGEKKKVALGAVLAINPEVLLLDEPTNGLDPRTQEWLIELLEQLHAAGKTIVIATHQLDQLDRLVERVLVLGEDHRPAADGPFATVLGDRELLLAVNLIHEHAHYHGALLHSHPHAHPPGQEHHDQAAPAHHHEHRGAAGGERAGAHEPGPAEGASPRPGPMTSARRRDPRSPPRRCARARRPLDRARLPVDAARIAPRLSGLLAGRDDVVFVAVADEAEIVGFVHAAERRLLVSEPFVELEGLIVTAAARRRGAAAELIAAVERWTLARGVAELRVRARLERDVADRFYRRQGFALEKQQRVFAKRLAGVDSCPRLRGAPAQRRASAPRLRATQHDRTIRGQPCNLFAYDAV